MIGIGVTNPGYGLSSIDATFESLVNPCLIIILGIGVLALLIMIILESLKCLK